MNHATAKEITEALTAQRDDRQSLHLQRFFKTGKGEYGEGDRFLGLKVPQTRAVVRELRHVDVPLSEIAVMLRNPWHEVRLCALLLLVRKCAKTPDPEVVDFYIAHSAAANNWDLVDLSAPYILGPWLADRSDRSVLDRFARSTDLWQQRIAIVATLGLIRRGQFDDTIRIALLLLDHPHDLIHKAVGWMLREVGKRDLSLLRDFLSRHAQAMPRTALRYAIEKLDPLERRRWLAVKPSKPVKPTKPAKPTK